MEKLPKTLQEAIRYFGNEQVCIDTVAALRWPDGKPVCPACEKTGAYWLASQKRWKCKECWKQFSVKLGTIFEDSAIPLCKWLIAMWLIANCKNGISSYEVARDLGITQKSAWHMMHRIRLAMQNGTTVKLGGPDDVVEADETFIGGKARNMHLSTKKRRINALGMIKGKQPVFGALERGGEVRVAVLESNRTKHIHEAVKRHVAAESALFTDALKSYNGLEVEYGHGVIDHAVKYVDGRVHTNGLENFWSLLKRGISGTYISVEPFHLFRYLDEQAFRYNNRKKPMDDSARFEKVLSMVTGKRIQYKELTGKEGKAIF